VLYILLKGKKEGLLGRRKEGRKERKNERKERSKQTSFLFPSTVGLYVRV
jgi:hypothetical protein